MAGSFQGGGDVVPPGGSFQGGGDKVDSRSLSDLVTGKPAAPSTGHDPFFAHIMQGLTFGLSDEASAATNASARWLYNTLTNRQNAPSFGEDYAKVLAENRGELSQYAKAHPTAATAAELGGGLLTGGAGAERVMATKALGLARVPRFVKAAGTGAVAGGAAGFGEGEGGLGPRLESAAVPAAAGAILGGALPPLLNLGGKVFNLATTWARPAATLADRKIAQALERDQLSPQDAAARLVALGPDATLADVGGRSTTRLARGTAGASPSAEDLASRTYEARQAGQGERVAGEASTWIGAGRDFHGTVDQLMEQRATAAKPLYDQAYAANQSMDSPEIDRVLMTPAGKSALRQAAVKMQNDMTLLGKPDPELTAQAAEAARLGLMEPHGSGIGVAKGLKLRTLDYVKRSLDDQINSAYRAGNNDDARILVGLKKKLVSSMDDIDVTGISGPNSRLAAGGKYAQARAAYAGPTQSTEALDMGRNIFKGDANVTAQQVADLKPGDLAFFRVGAVRAIQDAVENAPDGANAVARIFGKPALRDKLRAAFPNDDAFASFQQAMQRESRFYATRRDVLQGSRTAPMGEDMKDVGSAAIPYITDAARGNVPGLVDRTLGALWARATTPSARVADQLGPRLFSQDQTATAELLARLGMRPPPAATGAARRAAIATGLSGTTGLQFGR